MGAQWYTPLLRLFLHGRKLPEKKIVPLSLTFTGVGAVPCMALGSLLNDNATLATAGGEKIFLFKEF